MGQTKDMPKIFRDQIDLHKAGLDCETISKKLGEKFTAVSVIIQKK